MTWTVRITCDQCVKVIGIVAPVSTMRGPLTLEHVRAEMRKHETAEHGGKP